jgi:hypothetical protein
VEEITSKSASGAFHSLMANKISKNQNEANLEDDQLDELGTDVVLLVGGSLGGFRRPGEIKYGASTLA